MDPLPFSACELVATVLCLGALAMLVRAVRRRRLADWALHIAVLLVWGYAGVCALWGTQYYGTGFAEKAGMTAPPVSAVVRETVEARPATGLTHRSVVPAAKFPAAPALVAWKTPAIVPETPTVTPLRSCTWTCPERSTSSEPPGTTVPGVPTTFPPPFRAVVAPFLPLAPAALLLGSPKITAHSSRRAELARDFNTPSTYSEAGTPSRSASLIALWTAPRV